MDEERFDYGEEGIFEDELTHYGTPRHSGRYPWGSGKNPYQGDCNFIARVHDMRKSGYKEVAIAKSMGMNTSQLRAKMSHATENKKIYETQLAIKLKAKGYSTSAIARRMGMNESSVRGLLAPSMEKKRNLTKDNAEVLREAVRERKYIDIGEGTEQLMGIKAQRLSNAVSYLQEEGYTVHNIYVKQLGTGKDTTIKVLAAPGTTLKEVNAHRNDISLVTGYHSEDGGNRSVKNEPPVSVDSKRVAVRYSEDGGILKDGVIELRRGVPDISLGNANYAQVRIAVDGTHYIKGMAVYSDDLPKGVDILFNTNKSKSVPMMSEDKDNSVFKPMKKDKDNPFGANILEDGDLIRAQRHYTDENGERKLSALNIVSEEGTWGTWSKTLASQFLSKQYPALAKKQLDEKLQASQDDFDEIMSLTNPTVKAQLLNDFAGKCDSNAVHLKAAALPRQSTKVILPLTTINDDECYAPTYRDGEKLALVRYPHAGIFEIPIVTVNNKNKEGKSTITPGAIDAIGISHKSAQQLSGADFDGDTAIAIPIDKIKIKTKSMLPALQDFDHLELYKAYPGMKRITVTQKNREMGVVSNLITDMTIKGATESELVRAVKHSMVIIDSEKHNLNWKQSYIDNDIESLKQKYQPREDGKYGGASTIISRSKSVVYIPDRQEITAVSRMKPWEKEAWDRGEKIYRDTGKQSVTYKTDKNGNRIYSKKPKMNKITAMESTDDAYSLVSGGSKENTHPIESYFADYANSMKALANKARREARGLEDIKYDPAANKTYSVEVAALEAALNIAKRNAPFERQAQIMANRTYSEKLKVEPDMDKEHKKRLKGQVLTKARQTVGAGKQRIHISESQWKAINAGAISPSKLKDILRNTDPDRLRQLAMPKKENSALSVSDVSRIKSMMRNGYTQADIADDLGISVSTLQKALND